MKKHKKMNRPTNSNFKQDQLRAAEQKVFAGLWIQVIGNLLEAQGASQELKILKRYAKSKGIQQSFYNEEQVVTGLWLQAMGQAIEAIGFTKQLATNTVQKNDGEKIVIIGIWLQAIGSVLEATSETSLFFG